MNEYISHDTVMCDEVLNFLFENVDISSSSTKYFADLTFGGGGHSLAILLKNPKNRVIAVDQDPEAIKNGHALLQKYEKSISSRIRLIKSNFINFPSLAENLCLESFEDFEGFMGIVMDLGVSTHHLKKSDRGFSFKNDAKLDMRMDCEDDSKQTALEIVNTYSAEDLADIFFKYGEERYAKRVALNIVEQRSQKKINTTKELENIIFHSYPKKNRFGKINPSTRCFQALRIKVNNELHVLSEVIGRLIPLLKSKGRLAIISFHSLEDRIVKTEFKKLCAKEGPCIRLTKKPILPSEVEINKNFRSRSAKMRVIERK